MNVITDLDAAMSVVSDACGAADAVRSAEWWRLSGPELLDVSVAVERLSRLVFATQVALGAELDTQNVAADHGCVSTAALLRQTLVISAGDAKNRVDTARAVLPRDAVSGGEIPPVLPLLGEALAAGAIGVEQTRTIVASMNQIPAVVDDSTRNLCQKHLVENGILTEPKPFAAFARAVIGTITEDEVPDEDRSRRIELFLGRRSPATGMTRFHGQLDDLGVEVVSQAIDALAKPCPAKRADTSEASGNAGAASAAGTGTAGAVEAGETGPVEGDEGQSGGCVRSDTDAKGHGGADDCGGAAAVGVSGSTEGAPDSRSAACRRGQALIEALRRFLDQGTAPIQGGQRPHITVTIGLDALRRGIGTGTLDFGGPVSAGILRMLACDAAIIPAVLGSASQVLDVGRANRLFPPGIRKAIALRDRGCAFPGCDRPPGWTEAHHIRHWIHGGPSSLDNGVLLCARHHHEIHRGHWEVRMAADLFPEFLPPEWIDKERKPRRNTSHHIPALLGVR